MDAFLRRRNTDNNPIFGDTVGLEPLNQFACLSNDRVRFHVLRNVDKGEVWTGVPLEKCSAVLSELFKVLGQFGVPKLYGVVNHIPQHRQHVAGLLRQYHFWTEPYRIVHESRFSPIVG